MSVQIRMGGPCTLAISSSGTPVEFGTVRRLILSKVSLCGWLRKPGFGRWGSPIEVLSLRLCSECSPQTVGEFRGGLMAGIRRRLQLAGRRRLRVQQHMSWRRRRATDGRDMTARMSCRIIEWGFEASCCRRGTSQLKSLDLTWAWEWEFEGRFRQGGKTVRPTGESLLGRGIRKNKNQELAEKETEVADE